VTEDLRCLANDPASDPAHRRENASTNSIIADEETCVERLLKSPYLSASGRAGIRRRTERLVREMRRKDDASGGIEALQE
jgi:hypothetical protein